MRRRRQARPDGREAALEALYAQIPEMDCAGLCWDSCGPLPITKLEQRRIKAETGQVVPHASEVKPPYLCPALTMLRACAVYAHRPLICRLWGAVDNLPCNFGCMPKTGRRLTVVEGYELLAQAEELDGRPVEAARIREAYATSELAAAFTAAAIADRQDQTDAYDRRRREAHARGPVLYVRGPGKVASTPDRLDR